MRTPTTPEYRTWAGIKQRCTNSNFPYFSRYGGRGIRICKEWAESFTAFFAYVGPRPSPKHSIDRWPDNDGNYEPGNVRWATPKEQAHNRRRLHFIAFNGRTQILADWARETGLSETLLIWRLAHCWAVEQALTSPVGPQGRKRGAQEINHGPTRS